MNEFKQFVDMLTRAKIKYAQVDHGDGRSTLIIDRVHVDFERGKIVTIRNVPA